MPSTHNLSVSRVSHASHASHATGLESSISNIKGGLDLDQLGSRASGTSSAGVRDMSIINQQLATAQEYEAQRTGRDRCDIQDSSEIPDNITDEYLSDGEDRQIGEEESKQIDSESKKNYLESDVFDSIVKFMKTDDLISEREMEFRQEITPLKKQRTDLENFLIGYLEEMDNDFIQLGKTTKLTKVETENVAPIKPENVADALVEGFRKHELYTEEEHDEMVRVVKDLLIIVDSKRERSIKKKIARVDIRAEQEKEERAQKRKEKAEATQAKKKAKAKASAKAGSAKAKAAPKAGPKKGVPRRPKN